MILRPRSLRERMLDARGRKGQLCALVDPYRFGGGGGGAADPDFASVGLLIPGDALITVIGTNYVADISSVARTVQASNAGAGVSTTTKKFGAGALKLSSSTAGGFAFSTSAGGSIPIAPRVGDFTLDFWLYVTSGSMADASAFSTIIQFTPTRQFYFARAPVGSAPYNQFYAQVPGGATGDLTTGHITALTPDAWHFISWQRDSVAGFSYIHVDGNLEATIADANDYGDSADSVSVCPALGANEEFFVDDLRMTMGVCRYGASNYAVPTAAAPDH